MDDVTAVRVPAIPFPGGASQAELWREAAAHLEGGYPVGGSNLTAAVVRLLRATADAVDGQGAPMRPQTECTGVAARWCPVHGTCCCVAPENSMDDLDCPLHSPASSHAEKQLAEIMADGEWLA